MYIDECVLAVGSEENMKNYDYNDDFANLIDQNLSLPGVRETYKNGEKHDWILKVNDEFIRDGLKHLNDKQIAIIEALFFEGKCLEDICNKYCLSHEELLEEIRQMEIKVVKY